MSKGKFGSVFSDKPLKDHVEDYKKASKEREARGGKDGENAKYPVYLNMKDGESREVRFLDVEPVTFDQHRVWDNSAHEGKGGWRVFSCTREPDCPLCVAGSRAGAKFAWQVIDLEHLDKDHKPVPRVKLWVRGVKFAELLYRKSTKYDPTKENVLLERMGDDKNTQYSIERADNDDPIRYDKDEAVDLQEYFGLDDAKYKDMCRVAGDIRGGSARSKGDDEKPSRSKNANRGERSDEDEPRPSKGKRSKLEKEEDEDDIPF